MEGMRIGDEIKQIEIPHESDFKDKEVAKVRESIEQEFLSEVESFTKNYLEEKKYPFSVVSADVAIVNDLEGNQTFIPKLILQPEYGKNIFDNVIISLKTKSETNWDELKNDIDQEIKDFLVLHPDKMEASDNSIEPRAAA